MVTQLHVLLDERGVPMQPFCPGWGWKPRKLVHGAELGFGPRQAPQPRSASLGPTARQWPLPAPASQLRSPGSPGDDSQHSTLQQLRPVGQAPTALLEAAGHCSYGMQFQWQKHRTSCFLSWIQSRVRGAKCRCWLGGKTGNEEHKYRLKLRSNGQNRISFILEGSKK